MDFAPHVTATCKAGLMNVRVLFTSPFSGAIHARDFRNPHCMAFGNGTTSVAMTLNLQAKQGQNDYCGILVSNANSEVSPLFNTLIRLIAEFLGIIIGVIIQKGISFLNYSGL